MTVTLAPDLANALVHVEATALGAADVALVERSTNLVAWTTVRGGAYVAPRNWRIVTDAFGRSVSSSWGSPDVGPGPYVNSGGAASDFSVSSDKGRHSLTSVNVTRQSLLGVNLRDVEQVVTITASATALTQSINARIGARIVDANNQWQVKIEFRTTGNVDVGLNKIAGGSSTFPASASSATTYTPGSNVNCRWRVVGDNLKIKVWSGALTAEPGPWTIDYTEAVAAITSGGVSLSSDLTTGNTNTLPITVTFDDYAVDEIKVVLDDYEYVPGVLNTYRVRGIETGAISLVGVAAAATANNANVAPALPTGLATGDLMLLLASIRNSGAGTVNTPAGWTPIAASGNLSLFGRDYVAGDAAPTVTFSGGVVNADTIGQIAAFRRADIVPIATPVAQLNGSAQNISYPAQVVGADRALVVVAGWKQDDFTSVATLAGFTEIAEASTTTGDDASQVWDYQVQTLIAAVAAGSFTVTGGASAISRGMFAQFPHSEFLNEQSASLTPTLDRIWLKSPARPFLNRAVTVVDWSPVGRPARASDHDAVGRTLPIAVTDIGGSRRFALELYAATHADAQTLDYLMAAGDVMFLHTPVGCEVPGPMFVRRDTSAERRPRPRASSRVLTVPLVEAAAPGPDVVAAVGTWSSVLAAFATWQDVLNAFPTWADLLAYHGAPSEVIVP